MLAILTAINGVARKNSVYVDQNELFRYSARVQNNKDALCLYASLGEEEEGEVKTNHKEISRTFGWD